MNAMIVKSFLLFMQLKELRSLNLIVIANKNK
jgi:hypothetical protein